MRSRAVELVALALVAAGLVVMIGDVQARSERTAQGEIQVTAKNIVHTYRELGRRGRISDASEQAWSLRDRFGRTIGRLVMVCRWVTTRDRLCNGQMEMPRGTIAFGGATVTSFYGAWAVVGGTGKYDGADGVARFTAIGRGRMALVVTLT